MTTRRDVLLGTGALALTAVAARAARRDDIAILREAYEAMHPTTMPRRWRCPAASQAD